MDHSEAKVKPFDCTEYSTVNQGAFEDERFEANVQADVKDASVWRDEYAETEELEAEAEPAAVAALTVAELGACVVLLLPPPELLGAESNIRITL